MNKLERLEGIYDAIRSYGNSESGFKHLYDLLESEIHIESLRSSRSESSYLNNLVQTRDKEADTFITTARKYKQKNRGSAYGDFVSNFRTDVSHEMSLIKMAKEVQGNA